MQYQCFIKMPMDSARTRNLGNTMHARFSLETEMEFGLKPSIGLPSSPFAPVF
jgi:hypothetical protein